MKQGLTSWFLIGAFLLAWNGDLRAQNLDKVLITHSSESIRISPIVYGMIQTLDYSLSRRAVKEIGG